ncbi:MAG: hypothetical protein AAFN74_19275 [Myxococcota bacterium]
MKNVAKICAWGLSCGLLSLSACTDSRLQPIDDIEVNVVDNLLEIEGEVCTDPPEATDFPVKILFIIDGSGSMQFVDIPARRALAVEETILRLRANPSVSFAVIRFNESDAVLTAPNAQITAGDPFGVDLSGAFTRDPGVLQTAVQGLRVADSVTDYQGAFSAAFSLLSQDMLQSPPAQLARTKYVVLFLSDGDPFPACCSNQSVNSGVCVRDDRHIFFCNNPNAIRQRNDQLPFLVGGEDYNQPYQIFGAVQDIVDLAENFQVGELRMHTAFLFDPTLVDQLNPDGCFVIGGVNFVCPDRARPLLQGISELGDGVFRDFSRAEEIDFLGFDLTNIKRENAMKNLIVTNTNLRPGTNGTLALDTDGDGLSDELEFQNGLNRTSRDSDNDGYSDTLEWRRRRNGLDPAEPNTGCETDFDRSDADADGLARCEEVLLRTSVDLFDTDADGVPDGLEVIADTDPAQSDALADSDLDGVRNGDEIRFHTSISFGEGSARPGLAYRYRTNETARSAEGGRCYAFNVKNVQLDTPLGRPGEARSFGRNDLFVYMAEAPFDDPNDFGQYKVACVQATYVAPDFKDPPTGKVRLTPDDFYAPDALDPSQHCVGLSSEVP